MWEVGNMDKNMDNNYIDKISNKEVIRQLIIFAMSIEESCKNFWMKPVSIRPSIVCLWKFSVIRMPRKTILPVDGCVCGNNSGIPEKLEKGGYIKRETVEEDNRFNKITITEKGNKVVEQSKQIFDLVHQKVFEGFSEEEKRTLFTLLQKLNSNLDRMEAETKIERGRI